MFDVRRTWRAGVAAPCIVLAALAVPPGRVSADAGNLREPEPYITCTTGALLDGVHYVYVGRFARALWAMDSLKFSRATVYTRRYATDVRMDSSVVAAGAKPILRMDFQNGYRVKPYSFWITSEPVRLGRPPRRVTTVFRTGAGKWSVENYLRSDGQVVLQARYGPEMSKAMTRPFTAEIAVDGNKSVYTASFRPNLAVESTHVANLFSIGRKRFETKPVNTPGCVDDATDQPPRILYPFLQRR